ncbi:MAG: LysR substrate-binding domain-containing protein [Casimicrobiaceae bacterium]
MPLTDSERLARYLKLRELRAILAISQSGSILAAAAALGSTQPALTRTLAGAEAKLGVKLFERLPRGVRPTVFGEAILARISAIFGEIRGAAEDIAALNGLSQGTVSIGAMPLAAAGLVPKSLQRLFSARPGLRATVLEGNPEFLLNELRARRIEIVVGRVKLAEGDRDLGIEVMYDEALALVARTSHPLHRKPRLRLRDLANESWILPPADTAFYSQIAAMFERAGMPIPPHQIRTLSLPVNLGTVVRTKFVSIIPRSILILGFVGPGIRPLPVALPPTRGPVGFIRLAGAKETPALREFMTCAREVAAAIENEDAPGNAGGQRIGISTPFRRVFRATNLGSRANRVSEAIEKWRRS